MLQLAIETSSVLPGAALADDGRLLGTWSSDQPRAHAAALVSSLQGLCDSHGVEPLQVRRLLVSIGPGSFTGLRIGVMIARTMALAASRAGQKLDIVAVPSLDAIGWNALDLPDPPRFLAVISDAKRGRVYGATLKHDGDQYRTVTAACEIEPARLFDTCPQHCVVTGEGIALHAESVANTGFDTLSDSLRRPRATSVLQLGAALAANNQFTAPRDLVPAYVRRPEAEERWEDRQTRSS